MVGLRSIAIGSWLWSACGAHAPAAGHARLSPVCVDLGLTSAQDCQAVLAMVLPETLPPARGNAVGDDLGAAQLGFQVFFNTDFSSVNMRCATCHFPEQSFADGRPVAVGNQGQPLARNSLSILTAAWNSGDFFWDGRADSMWSQPLFAFENAQEMATTRLEIAHTLFTSTNFYRPLYETVFGPMPDLSDAQRFPAAGKPGDPTFDGMASDDRDTINRIAANLGKALEAYMRKVAVGRSALDFYLLGQSDALSALAKRGLATFVGSGCTTCHSGPTLSDGRYYDMHVPARADASPDPGRAAGLTILAANPFNAQGPYFDVTQPAASPPPPEATAADGAFRTPTLRELSITGPYGHNGAYPALADVLAAHGSVALSADQIADISAFFLALNGAYPVRPWNNWPGH